MKSSARTVTKSRPFIFINMAMTADGKIATANRVISSFGSKRDVEHLYELRATADGVMAGARTLDSNAVLLGPGGEKFKRLRRRNGLSEYSLRIIVSGAGSIDPNAAIFRRRFSPIILLTTERASRSQLNQVLHLVDDAIVGGQSEIDFASALVELRRRWKIKRLLCEGGGELNAALFRARLVDELHLTICPKIFGGREAPTIAEGTNVHHLIEAAQLKLKSMEQIGEELFCVYRAKRHTVHSKAR